MSDLQVYSFTEEEKADLIMSIRKEERERILTALLSEEVVKPMARRMWSIDYPNGLIPPETSAKYEKEAKAALTAAAEKLRREGVKNPVK